MLGAEKRKGSGLINRNFGGREHWGAQTTNGFKQSTSRDTNA